MATRRAGASVTVSARRLTGSSVITATPPPAEIQVMPATVRRAIICPPRPYRDAVNEKSAGR
jgi:hypothetical protein